jgi:hypothetical protein
MFWMKSKMNSLDPVMTITPVLNAPALTCSGTRAVTCCIFTCCVFPLPGCGWSEFVIGIPEDAEDCCKERIGKLPVEPNAQTYQLILPT